MTKTIQFVLREFDGMDSGPFFDLNVTLSTPDEFGEILGDLAVPIRDAIKKTLPKGVQLVHSSVFPAKRSAFRAHLSRLKAACNAFINTLHGRSDVNSHRAQEGSCHRSGGIGDLPLL